MADTRVSQASIEVFFVGSDVRVSQASVEVFYEVSDSSSALRGTVIRLKKLYTNVRM